MKGFALILTALCLATAAQGLDYELQCTKDEMGIRWPSYHSSSEFYVCNRIGGRQIKMSCAHGELFTFVLQSCTSPGRYIPAPPMNILPTSSSITKEFSSLPVPIYSSEDKPSVISAPPQPPVISGEHPMPIKHELPHGDHINESEKSSETNEELSVKPVLPNKPNSPVTVPLPPTPAPTPPVVKKPVKPAVKPQPQAPGKKQLAPPNKKEPTTANKKKPAQPSKKQQAPIKNEPKAQKKPPTAKKPAPPKE